MNELCTYCGEIATDRDHVIPWSYHNDGSIPRRRHYDKREIVPACKECNGLLSNWYIPSISERAGYIHKTLKLRYKKLLKTPEWSDEELEEMGKFLRIRILENIEKKKRVVARIAYSEKISRSRI